MAILDPLNEEKNYLSALFFEHVLPQFTAEILKISEQNYAKSSYNFGNLVEVFFKLSVFLLKNHEIKMIEFIMRKELLQGLYKVINPENKIMMINFVKFFTQLILCKD